MSAAHRSSWKSSFLGLGKEADTRSVFMYLRGGAGESSQGPSLLPPSPRLSAGSETPSEKEGNPVLGVPITMYCNSLYILKKIL